MTNPPHDQEWPGAGGDYRFNPAPPPQPIRPLPVIGGFVIGAAAWMILQLALFAMVDDNVGVVYGFVTAPLVVAVGLLISPRTRQAGAGLLLGVAVSTIVFAGLCIAILASY